MINEEILKKIEEILTDPQSYWKTSKNNSYVILCKGYPSQDQFMMDFFHLNQEEVNSFLMLTETQRKIILLQSQKEKIEKEIDELLNKTK